MAGLVGDRSAHCVGRAPHVLDDESQTHEMPQVALALVHGSRDTICEQDVGRSTHAVPVHIHGSESVSDSQ